LDERKRIGTYIKVRNTNTFRPSTLIDLLNLSPYLLQLFISLFPSKERLVQKIKINVVQPELLQACIKRFLDVIEVIVELGSDKQFIATEARFAKSFANFVLGLVGLGSINVGEV
jgi:hypothetical protein